MSIELKRLDLKEKKYNYLSFVVVGVGVMSFT